MAVEMFLEMCDLRSVSVEFFLFGYSGEVTEFSIKKNPLYFP